MYKLYISFWTVPVLLQFPSTFGSLEQTAYLSLFDNPIHKSANQCSSTEDFWFSKNLAYQKNFHIKQFHGHSDNAKKILAGPKTVCVTAKVSSFESFYPLYLKPSV